MMRAIVNLSLLVFIALMVSCSIIPSHSDLQDNRGLTLEYKIKRIKRYESYCIIYAARNDSTFKIISWAGSSPIDHGEKIKVRESYPLELETVYPLSRFLGIPMAPNAGIEKGLHITRDGINYIWVKAERKSHNSLYIARNLNGVYLIKKE